MEQDFPPAVVQSAAMIQSFYRHKAMRWRQIPPQVLAATELVTGLAQRGPNVRSTPEQTPAARQTRSTSLAPDRNWPTEWELDRSVLNLAIRRFLQATAQLRSHERYQAILQRFVSEGGFESPPLGPKTLRNEPPYLSRELPRHEAREPSEAPIESIPQITGRHPLPRPPDEVQAAAPSGHAPDYNRRALGTRPGLTRSHSSPPPLRYKRINSQTSPVARAIALRAKRRRLSSYLPQYLRRRAVTVGAPPGRLPSDVRPPEPPQVASAPLGPPSSSSPSLTGSEDALEESTVRVRGLGISLPAGEAGRTEQEAGETPNRPTSYEGGHLPGEEEEQPSEELPERPWTSASLARDPAQWQTVLWTSTRLPGRPEPSGTPDIVEITDE
ncbi:hypothetical protein KEM52_001666, partial [Ascosphaera acerosa]